RIEIAFVQVAAVDSHLTVVNFDSVARYTDNALDITLRWIFRKPKHNYVATINFRGPAIIILIDQFVDEDALTFVQIRQHRRAFDLDRLNDEDHHQRQHHKPEHSTPTQHPTLL